MDGISTLTALFATVFDPGISILYLLLYPKSTYTVLIFWGLERKRRFMSLKKKKPRKHANKFFLTCKNSKKWHLVRAFELNSSSRPLCCHGASWIKRLNYKSG